MIAWAAVARAGWSLAKRGASGLFAFLGTRTGRMVLCAVVLAGCAWWLRSSGHEAGYAEAMAICRKDVAKADMEALDHLLDDIKMGAAIATETRERLSKELASIDVQYDVDLKVIRERTTIAAPPAACVADPVVVQQLEDARARANAAADRLRATGAR